MLSPSVPTDDMDVSLPSNLPAGSEDDADNSSESDSDSDVSLYLRIWLLMMNDFLRAL